MGRFARATAQSEEFIAVTKGGWVFVYIGKQTVEEAAVNNCPHPPSQEKTKKFSIAATLRPESNDQGRIGNKNKKSYLCGRERNMCGGGNKLLICSHKKSCTTG